ncbi:MAG: tRNA (N(6)-L-threonylcarbamoyladenosine(37)-C(2))-methylthiotransferase MtaB [Nitrospirota bacterium]
MSGFVQDIQPKPPKVAFHTMGCRLNQSETDTLASSFFVEGCRVVSADQVSDIAVINTCSVTESAEATCRYTIRKILRQSPKTFIAVTGCYAQVGVEALRKIPGIDLIAGTDHKMLLPALVLNAFRTSAAGGKNFSKLSEPLVFHTPKISRDDFVLPTYAAFAHQTRPNIKIQDGCDFFCSFCIIPNTRGRERSRQWDNILLEAALWAAQEHQEIVLTGVNLGEYTFEGRGLNDLIDALSEISGLARIRISSIEPTTIAPGLFEKMRNGKLCSHLHLPLQSGSDAVLSNMGRRYTREDYRVFVKEAMTVVPNLSLGSDVMVGFPGEGEAEFAETVSLLTSLPFSYFHVFPFSERKGTRVTRMGLPNVPATVIKKRVHHLLDLSKKKREAFYQQAVGESFDVLFEHRNEAGLFEGLTENYIRVGVATNENLRGKILPVRIEKVAGGVAYANLL